MSKLTSAQKKYIQRARTEPIHVFSVPGIRENARFGYGAYMNSRTWNAIKPYLRRISLVAVGSGGYIRDKDGTMSSFLEYREEWRTKEDN